MTEREKFDIAETKERIFARDNYTCRACLGSIFRHGSPQLAHGISKTKANIKKWGAEVIHSDYNLYSACVLGCNAMLSVGKSNEPAEAERIKKLLA